MEEKQFHLRILKVVVSVCGYQLFRQRIVVLELSNDIHKHKEYNTHLSSIQVKQPGKSCPFLRLIH